MASITEDAMARIIIHGCFGKMGQVLAAVAAAAADMTVVAGRPGTGKTSLALDVAAYLSLDYKYAVPDPANPEGEWLPLCLTT
jgi:replicative DNA helicase